jgi:regulator of sigma E protease
MLATLSTIFDLALVVLGFGFVILIHELGHFLAARWAGIRVDAFAIGFGPAICSWRKGLGFRMGSSEQEVMRKYGSKPVKTLDDAGAIVEAEHDREATLPPTISPTEYRLNWLPFGGYVKMLGQDDVDPKGATTERAPDSFMSKSVPQRMVVISAGVIMNVILAAILFVLVFMVGLKQEAPVIGYVVDNSPAASATTTRDDVEPGLRIGDRILSIDGGETPSFQYVMTNVAMARGGRAIDIVVEREGVEGLITFTATPRTSAATGLLEVGMSAAFGPVFADPSEYPPDVREMVATLRDRHGLASIPPGATLVEVNGKPVTLPSSIEFAARASNGAPITLTFESPAGERVSATIAPEPVFASALVSPARGAGPFAESHILGLTPAMRVDRVNDGGRSAGLQDHDVFARIANVEWPTLASGVNAVRTAANNDIDIVVLRSGERVTLTARVTPEGTIGFAPGEALDANILAATSPGSRPGASLTPPVTGDPDEQSSRDWPPTFAAQSLDLPPGTVIRSIDGETVSSFFDIHAALVGAKQRATDEGVTVALVVELPMTDASGAPIVETHEWPIPSDDLASIAPLMWTSPIGEEHFRPLMVTRKASNPIGAIGMGFVETRRVMASAYLTIARLFQGSVKVEHLKGPVGIAHIGTVVAKRGVIDLIFFMAIISVNLAVLNFLPLPIVDGGLFVFLLWEGVTGRPVSPNVQAATAMLGLLLIGALFLLVTFNDITNLIGG